MKLLHLLIFLTTPVYSAGGNKYSIRESVDKVKDIENELSPEKEKEKEKPEKIDEDKKIKKDIDRNELKLLKEQINKKILHLDHIFKTSIKDTFSENMLLLPQQLKLSLKNYHNNYDKLIALNIKLENTIKHLHEQIKKGKRFDDKEKSVTVEFKDPNIRMKYVKKNAKKFQLSTLIKQQLKREEKEKKQEHSELIQNVTNNVIDVLDTVQNNIEAREAIAELKSDDKKYSKKVLEKEIFKMIDQKKDNERIEEFIQKIEKFRVIEDHFMVGRYEKIPDELEDALNLFSNKFINLRDSYKIDTIDNIIKKEKIYYKNKSENKKDISHKCEIEYSLDQDEKIIKQCKRIGNTQKLKVINNNITQDSNILKDITPDDIQLFNVNEKGKQGITMLSKDSMWLGKKYEHITAEDVQRQKEKFQNLQKHFIKIKQEYAIKKSELEPLKDEYKDVVRIYQQRIVKSQFWNDNMMQKKIHELTVIRNLLEEQENKRIDLQNNIKTAYNLWKLDNKDLSLKAAWNVSKEALEEASEYVKQLQVKREIKSGELKIDEEHQKEFIVAMHQAINTTKNKYEKYNICKKQKIKLELQLLGYRKILNTEQELLMDMKNRQDDIHHTFQGKNNINNKTKKEQRRQRQRDRDQMEIIQQADELSIGTKEKYDKLNKKPQNNGQHQGQNQGQHHNEGHHDSSWKPKIDLPDGPNFSKTKAGKKLEKIKDRLSDKVDDLKDDIKKLEKELKRDIKNKKEDLKEDIKDKIDDIKENLLGGEKEKEIKLSKKEIKKQEIKEKGQDNLDQIQAALSTTDFINQYTKDQKGIGRRFGGNNSDWDVDMPNKPTPSYDGLNPKRFGLNPDFDDDDFDNFEQNFDNDNPFKNDENPFQFYDDDNDDNDFDDFDNSNPFNDNIKDINDDNLNPNSNGNNDLNPFNNDNLLSNSKKNNNPFDNNDDLDNIDFYPSFDKSNDYDKDYIDLDNKFGDENSYEKQYEKSLEQFDDLPDMLDHTKEKFDDFQESVKRTCFLSNNSNTMNTQFMVEGTGLAMASLVFKLKISDIELKQMDISLDKPDLENASKFGKAIAKELESTINKNMEKFQDTMNSFGSNSVSGMTQIGPF